MIHFITDAFVAHRAAPDKTGYSPRITCLRRKETSVHIFRGVVQTHQACRHPGIPAAEPGLVAEVLTQRETTHTAQTLCEGTHGDNTSKLI